MPTIVELSNQAGIHYRALLEHANLPPEPSKLQASTSGFDVALTLIEQSTGARFSDLDAQTACRVISYFVAEAARAEDRYIAAFYNAWGLTLWKAYPESGEVAAMAQAKASSTPKLVAWAPAGLSPALGATWLMSGPTTEQEWRNALQMRVQDLIDENPDEARAVVRHVLRDANPPMLHPETQAAWAETLFAAVPEIRNVLDQNLETWPVLVTGCGHEVEDMIQDVTLEKWLCGIKNLYLEEFEEVSDEPVARGSANPKPNLLAWAPEGLSAKFAGVWVSPGLLTQMDWRNALEARVQDLIDQEPNAAKIIARILEPLNPPSLAREDKRVWAEVLFQAVPEIMESLSLRSTGPQIWPVQVAHSDPETESVLLDDVNESHIALEEWLYNILGT